MECPRDDGRIGSPEPSSGGVLHFGPAFGVDGGTDPSELAGEDVGLSAALVACGVQEPTVRSALDGPGVVCPVVIALDNDECIGSWVDLSMLFTLYTQALRVPAPMDVFLTLLPMTEVVRPGLRALYDQVLDLKARGHVHSIVMCTAARNSSGWVSFLRDLLEAWYGRRVYDAVIDGCLIQDWHSERGTSLSAPGSVSYIKDMHQVRRAVGVGDHVAVIAVDDHPENIINGHAIGVSPYYVALNLIEVARRFVRGWSTHHEARYARAMQSSWAAFQQDPARFACAADDVGMHKGLQALVDLLGRMRVAGDPSLGASVDCAARAADGRDM